MAMSPRLLRPIASGVHPEAAAWRSAVVANGGSVSASTVKAVSTFCAAIDSAGIRDRFYRLNLFAGTSLNAALVPLYRGPTYGGTTYGNATDTNNGPFVSGDFSEATGLDGNQTTKYLNTGLSQDDLPTQAVGHVSVWKGAGSVGAGTLALAGSTSPNGRNYYLRQNANTDYIAGQWASGAFATSSAADTSAGLVTLTRAGSSAAGAQIYKNDSLIVTGAGGVAEANGNDFIVFNVSGSTNTVGTSGWPHTISAYSFGDGLTGAQVGDFYDALSAFQTALGRP